MCQRNASSQYLLSGFLKCGECGANLVVVKGRASKYASYGCPQHYSRGACSNSVRIGMEKLETELFTRLQHEVLRPEVIELAIAESRRELEKATRDCKDLSTNYASRQKELETELRNLATAIAKGSGPTSFLLDAINERERELRDIKRLSQAQQPKPMQLSFEDLTEFVVSEIPNIRKLAQSDVPMAKVELGKHVQEIVLKPNADNTAYLVEGEWDILGKERFQALQIECGVGMVPGGGVEPPRGVNLGGF